MLLRKLSESRSEQADPNACQDMVKIVAMTQKMVEARITLLEE